MRILVVASDFPWPKLQGGHLRLATAIEALSELGDVDLFALDRYHRPDTAVPPNIPVTRLKTVTEHDPGHQLRWRAAWLARRGTPLEVVRERMDPTPRHELTSWVEPPYELVWFDRAAMFERMGRPRLGPTVVDFHDLEDVKAQLRLGIMRASPSRLGISDRVRRALAMAQTRLNARDWRGFQRSVARVVDRVVLSSDLDRRRSGLPNAVVVPNSYERPARPVGHVDVMRPAVALFQATFDYAPNVDAAEWLVAEVAPRLRSLVPDLGIRLVGRPVAGVTRLDRPPAVTVVGLVPDMEAELARADIAVVPVRYGSGTRFKILESFAHRVPVVSTTLGAEGLDVLDGVHLLLADDAETFAAASARLLTEPDLRQRLVEEAERFFLEHFECSSARDRIKALAREVAAPARAGRR